MAFMKSEILKHKFESKGHFYYEIAIGLVVKVECFLLIIIKPTLGSLIERLIDEMWIL